jgi:hypothetical protein
MVGITAELPGINEKNVERYDCSEWLPISISPPEGGRPRNLRYRL